MKIKILILYLACTTCTFAADFLANLKSMDTLDALDPKELVSDVIYLGEKNPRFELSQKMKARLDALQIRLDYPDAWRLYSRGEIQDFSYFGFKLYDLECGLISEEDFLKELQDYLKNFSK